MSNSKTNNAKRKTKASRQQRMARIVWGSIAIFVALAMIITMFATFLEW